MQTAQPTLPRFSDGDPSAARVKQILLDIDHVSALEIAALNKNERAAFLIQVRDWCRRFTEYHFGDEPTHPHVMRSLTDPFQ